MFMGSVFSIDIPIETNEFGYKPGLNYSLVSTLSWEDIIMMIPNLIFTWWIFIRIIFYWFQPVFMEWNPYS